MNHPWQQPIRPMELKPNVAHPDQFWIPVLFIAPYEMEGFWGWEALTVGGKLWDDSNAMIREVDR
jgi:hypothetical protein